MLGTSKELQELEWSLYERGYITLNEHNILSIYDRKTSQDVSLEDLSEDTYNLYLQIDFLVNNKEAN